MEISIDEIQEAISNFKILCPDGLRFFYYDIKICQAPGN